MNKPKNIFEEDTVVIRFEKPTLEVPIIEDFEVEVVLEED